MRHSTGDCSSSTAPLGKAQANLRCLGPAGRVSAIARGFPIVRTVKGEGDHEIVNPALREWLEARR
jgi:hypothetical protein